MPKLCCLWRAVRSILRLGLLTSALTGVVASAAVAQQALLSECMQKLGPDSVVLFFNAQYVLTPASCAVIKRHARLDTKGEQQGVVHDFWLPTGYLLARATYLNNKLHGPIELFYDNGQRAISGQFEQGTRRGDWHYWYASGKPWQQLRFPTDGKPRILNYWDKTNHAQVANGAGTWSGLSSAGLLSTGRVALGLPDGTWRGYRRGTRQLATIEYFERGRFRRGEPIDTSASRHLAPYHDRPALEPRAFSPIESAGPPQLGKNCAEQLRQQQSDLLREQLRLPTVRGGLLRYETRLALHLARYSSERWYEVLPPRAIIRCSLDTLGNPISYTSQHPALETMVRSRMSRMSASWRPARLLNRAVPGYLDIELDKETGQVRVRPAARLQPDQLPALPPPLLY